MPSGCRQPVTMTCRSEASGLIERMRPPLTSSTNRRPMPLPVDVRRVPSELMRVVLPVLLLACLFCRAYSNVIRDERNRLLRESGGDCASAVIVRGSRCQRAGGLPPDWHTQSGGGVSRREAVETACDD